jgi:tRNA threonylcarbamoyladenosine biosynthesis protein TsaB
MVQELLADCGYRLDQVDALAFGSGPGSFTGLRIGISVVQGLAFGIDRPVVPVSSLLALAARAGAPRVFAGIDARMEQVYWNVYGCEEGAGMVALKDPQVSDPADVDLPENGDWIAVGNGAEAYSDRLFRDQSLKVRFIRGVHPHAQDIACIAEREFEAGNAIDPRDAAPEYVRNRIVQP